MQPRRAIPFQPQPLSNLDGQSLPEAFQAEVRVMRDYYPFGMEMPGQVYVASEYRYGFNGMERDDEVKGTGASLNTPNRQFDSRLTRWLSVDPQMKYHESAFAGIGNNPVSRVDPNGDTDYYNRRGKWKGTDGVDNGQAYVVTSKVLLRLINKGKGTVVALDASSYRGNLLVPRAAVVFSKRESLNDVRQNTGRDPSVNDANFHEEGGYWTDVIGEVFRAMPGPYSDPSKVGAIPINPFLKENGVYAGEIELTSNSIQGYWHVHPDGKKGDYSWEQVPSGTGGIAGDISTQANFERAGYVGDAIMISTSNSLAHFYDGRGTRGTVKLRTLEKIVKGRSN